MDATNIIREAVSHVTLLRQTAADTPGLAQAISDIKLFQARRFAGTYDDLLHSERYQPAALFFLQELYSAKDYSERDSQFARIAGALERLFPQQVVQTAVSLAQLHRLTEDLDLAMAQNWMISVDTPEVARYVKAWRSVDRRSDRNTQVATVLNIGHELDRLTRTIGLRMMLKMMRGPANLAGLGSLQRFLESGFDTFAAMGRKGDGAAYFMDTVRSRESGLIDRLFDASAVACETEITQILGQPR
ncbi:FFLEELY motif protein [Rhodoferax sp. UBA5149]|uniref:FFLEELY motif protein n=1 Tax=Rhodoferax sp. UBA5149 TaxID=1947379 RepID=UPI0025F72B8C|nr:hypothetical protein [Rhodoferax sp. UBA5149]